MVGLWFFAFYSKRQPVYLKILDFLKLFVAEDPMKKKHSFTTSQSTLVMGRYNRPCVRGSICGTTTGHGTVGSLYQLRLKYRMNLWIGTFISGQRERHTRVLAKPTKYSSSTSTRRYIFLFFQLLAR